MTFALLALLCFLFSAESSEASADCDEFDVLVLGAGIAGVKAAATLFDNGVQNFAVIEQSHRIGGRMWNTGWQGRTVELGANWIEGIPQDEDPIWTIAQKIGLRGNYTMQEGYNPEPTLFDTMGRVHPKEAKALHGRLRDALNGAMAISCEQHRTGGGDISLREALRRAGWPAMDEQTPLEKALEFFVVDWDFEFPPENVSIFNYFDVGKEGSWREACSKTSGPKRTRRARTAARIGMLDGFSWEAPRYFVTDARGYAAVAEHVANESFLNMQLVRGRPCDTPRLVFNTTVAAIHYSGVGAAGRVRVETSDGQVYIAKHCITTFSSGVVNKAIRDRTLFYPALPEWKARAFAKTDPGVYTKIFVRYSRRFWDDADYVLYADPFRRGYYAVWQDMESHGKFFPQQANILMVTLVQSDSRRVENQPTEETIAELQATLRQMYGPDVPEPLDILIPKWHSNEFFRGSWSNVAIGTTGKDFELMQRAVGNLYFAGEATDAEYNGFVLGGYHSGETVARRVLQDMATYEVGPRARAGLADAHKHISDSLHSLHVLSWLLLSIVAVAASGIVVSVCALTPRLRPCLLGYRGKGRAALIEPMLST